ncbi:MAG: hypothetical protein ACRDD7_06405 [Peptostreptococcaceae bacterium]
MLSILTNFGCHFGCSYCVYRENGINIPRTDFRTFGWEQLEEQLKIHKGELISILGGGDPLYNHDNIENMEFYSRFFSLLEKYDCKLEMHTSIFDWNFPYELCERTVFHLTMPNQIKNLKSIKKRVELSPINRVVFVVQEHYTKHLIKEIVREVKDNFEINELSFRQMIGKDGKTQYYLHDYLKDGHMKDWYYIEQCDYNDYFVQDHIEREYLNIK